MKNKQYCTNGDSARAFKVRLNFLILRGIGSTAGTVLAPTDVYVKSAVDLKKLSVESNPSLLSGFSLLSVHKPHTVIKVNVSKYDQQLFEQFQDFCDDKDLKNYLKSRRQHATRDLMTLHVNFNKHKE
jgi:hypothetical protein